MTFGFQNAKLVFNVMLCVNYSVALMKDFSDVQRLCVATLDQWMGSLLSLSPLAVQYASAH